MVEELPKIVGGLAIDEEETVVVEEKISWSNLPADFLSGILSRLLAGDKVAYLSVCLSWRKSVPVSPPIQRFRLPISEYYCQSPCLLLLSKNRIFHPIYNEISPYMDFVHELDHTEVRVAKGDWLLVSGPPCGCELFFFNPFTKTKILVPDIPTSPRSLCFSSLPTSTDWQIVTGGITRDSQTVICSLKYGEECWTCIEFAERFDFSYCNAVIHKGSYYFLDKDAQVLIYNPNENKTLIRIYMASKYITKNIIREQYLFESSDHRELMAVFLNCEGSWIQTCRWDEGKKTWERVTSLGNKMLFVSRPLSLCEVASVRGTANKIYFPRFVGDDHCLFYSLYTETYHTFVPGSYYKSLDGSKLHIAATWIKPPSVN